MKDPRPAGPPAETATGPAEKAPVAKGTVPGSPPLPGSTHVAIVGAGPTGLTLALQLARAGVDFVVLDRELAGHNCSRATAIHARTLEVLQPLGVTEELIARGLRVDNFVIRDGRRRLLEVPLADLPTEYPFMLMIPQHETEGVLSARLAALGHTVRRPCEVTRVNQDQGGATLTLVGGETLRARYVVGADGMQSRVRTQAGIGFSGASYSQQFILADATLDTLAVSHHELNLFFASSGMTVVAPLPGGHFRIAGSSDRAPEEPTVDDIQALLDERLPDAARVLTTRWTSRFRVHSLVADRYRENRILLAGDAAHVHSPAGGQGMNTGIQDACLLGSCLADNALSAYNGLRRPVALRVAAFTDRLTRMATLRTTPGRGIRNGVLPVLGRSTALRRRAARELAELAY
ncbi:FAD-dependent oxidoreductase [Streptomyces parvus]|uniref:FAD-dependent oxidoreductase n=1 Tax=Streptomyces parvus TaxID=66428 RepID=A0A7K3S1B9_9ACTN|nr:FAD-dependent oxidoreductase [Streptomyces parvus]NEC21083.1 FAD-dependent oxidoreductase [Streptomyces parvus]